MPRAKQISHKGTPPNIKTRRLDSISETMERRMYYIEYDDGTTIELFKVHHEAAYGVYHWRMDSPGRVVFSSISDVEDFAKFMAQKLLFTSTARRRQLTDQQVAIKTAK